MKRPIAETVPSFSLPHPQDPLNVGREGDVVLTMFAETYTSGRRAA